MKLSEAIRLGSMLAPQARWALRDADGNTCALGAACEALGIRVGEYFNGRAVESFQTACPILRHKSHCPDSGCDYSGQLQSLIGHLNDTHLWTREQIADWLETVEAAQPDSESAQSRLTAQGAIR